MTSVSAGTTSERPPRAFLCYAREDRVAVDWLQDLLQQNEIPVWRDEQDLWPGDRWRHDIRAAIREHSLVFVACFSDASEAKPKGHYREELLWAIDELRRMPPGRRWLIPVRLTDCQLPDYDLGNDRTLESIHKVDLFGDDWRDQAGRLVTVIRRELEPDRSAPVKLALPETGPGAMAPPVDPPHQGSKARLAKLGVAAVALLAGVFLLGRTLGSATTVATSTTIDATATTAGPAGPDVTPAPGSSTPGPATPANPGLPNPSTTAGGRPSPTKASPGPSGESPPAEPGAPTNPPQVTDLQEASVAWVDMDGDRVPDQVSWQEGRKLRVITKAGATIWAVTAEYIKWDSSDHPRLVDVNGDGRPDLIYHPIRVGITYDPFLVLLNTGTSLAGETEWCRTTAGIYSVNGQHQIRFWYYNADSKIDFAYRENDGTNGWWGCLSSPGPGVTLGAPVKLDRAPG